MFDILNSDFGFQSTSKTPTQTTAFPAAMSGLLPSMMYQYRSTGKKEKN
jgi:hypothetical protein